MTARWSLVLALAACGGAAAPPASKTRARHSPKGPPAAACITASEDDTRITHASVDVTRVRYCIGADRDRCFAMELDGGKLERLAAPPDDGAASAHVEVEDPTLEVCALGRCTPLAAKVLPTASGIRGATNEDGSVAVFLLGDMRRGAGYAEIWDVTRSKRTATFRYARGDFRCGKVSILGSTIYVSAATCGQPAARAALYSLKGQKIANVGNRDFGSYGDAYVQLDGAVWAFLEENGNALAVQDIVKGKVLKTIDVAALWKAHDAEMGNPGESAVVRLSERTVIVIAGAPAAGSVGIVNIDTGEVTVVRATRCSGQ